MLRERISYILDSSATTLPQLSHTLSQFKNKSVLVIGDTIIDTIISSVPYGSSQKTPTLSVLKKNEANFLGGAAIVAMHLKNAGASVEFITVINDDPIGEWALEELEKGGITARNIKERGRITTRKSVIDCKGYKLLKLDEVDNRPIGMETLTNITEFMDKSNSDIFLFSDFRHGIFNNASIPILSSS